jgi:hypothetical protein
MDPLAHRLHQLVQAVQHVLDPFGHATDRARAAARWRVEDSDHVTEWFATLLRQCKGKTRCWETRRCVYYDTPERAAHNYKVCEGLYLEIEAGNLQAQLRPAPPLHPDADGPAVPGAPPTSPPRA